MEETLEEAAEHNYPGGDVWTEEQAVIRRLAFKNGAKWQAERMYSEEELKSAFRTGFGIGYGSDIYAIDVKDKICDEWFKQIKKK